MSELIITRGLPASGKTTVARQQVELREIVLGALEPGELIDRDPPRPLVRVNRDDLRAMLHVGDWSSAKEQHTRTARDALVLALLASGCDVICDDTHIVEREVEDMRRLADLAPADLVVVDLRQVPMEECIRRDQTRPSGVGREVIERLAKRGGLL